MTGPRFDDIRAELERRIADLCKDLAPDGHVNGGYWIARNPTRDDRNPGSFWIRLAPPVGVWKDEATGDTGDVIKLVGYINRLDAYAAIRRWCLAWLGWGGDMPPPSPRRIAADREKRAAEALQAEARRARDIAENRRRALGLWLGAAKIGRDIPPLVQRYLASRGLAVAELPAAIRFFASHDYILAEDRGRVARPCLIALMTGPDGSPYAVHRTWLEPDGAGKAVFPDPKRNPARKIWPAGWEGAVIRLAKGAEKMTPEEAVRQGVVDPHPLIETEGWEDGVAAHIACPDHRVWAAGTLGNLRHVPMLPHIERAIICADNDWNNRQASELLDAAVKTQRSQGRLVSVARSWRGKDVNDLMKGAT